MKKFSLLMLGILFLLATPQKAFSDTIVLKNGQAIEGKIIAETEKNITLKIKFGTMSFRRNKIKEVIRDKPEPVSSPEDDIMPDAGEPSSTSSGELIPSPSTANSTESLAGMIPNYGDFENMLFRVARENNFPDKHDWYRKEIRKRWEQHTETAEARWKKYMKNFLYKENATLKVDTKNHHDLKAQVKWKEGGQWQYSYDYPPESLPTTHENISECWVKRATYSRYMTGQTGGPSPGYVTQYYSTVEGRIWRKYHWDADGNYWSIRTRKQKKETSDKYEEEIRDELSKLEDEMLDGPRESQMRQALSYAKRIVEYIDKSTEGLDKEGLRQHNFRIRSDCAMGFERLLMAYDAHLKSRVFEVHLKKYLKEGWKE